HSLNRALTAAVQNGSVIVNNGVLAIMGVGTVTGGNTVGNGGGILNRGTLTLYAGEITGNKAGGLGGGVYNSIANTTTTGFWMTGGLIYGNTAGSYPAIGGDVTFNAQAVVQIDADGNKVSIAQALVELAELNFIKPIMPDYDDYTGIDDVVNEELPVTKKVFRNGRVIIMHNGAVYNTAGQIVR
ncbi:MAG: hypothetical protein J5630_01290, partial [Bacteroidaceae bacterium]|nr:hypothetical protein [Bacteroidaceae bacterium]